MSKPTIEQGWEAFIHHWGLYHKVEMSGPAKAALLRAFCGNHDVLPPTGPPPPPLPPPPLQTSLF